MTGTYSIKRRLSPRPQGQMGVLSALGIGVGRSSDHPGSKRGYAHVRPLDSRAARAQMWAAETGRPIPPHLRARQPLEPAEPLTTEARIAGYLGVEGTSPAGLALALLPVSDLLDSPLLTPAQTGRALRKAGHNGERPAGWQPERPAQGPARPRGIARQRRARKDARQKARHADRPPWSRPGADVIGDVRAARSL